MRSARAQTRINGIRLVVLTVVSLLLTGALAMIMGNLGFGASREFRAVFADASSITEGNDVRVAGVSVGKVTDVAPYLQGKALVTFEVEDGLELTTSTHVAVRFLNLVGTRYLTLEPGTAKSATPLEPGSLIPESRTEPALNLTALFNGFRPLFAALDPREINEFSLNLVKVLQGEGGTVASLLRHTGSLTNTLADRDKLIGQVINNLQGTLTTVDVNRKALSELIVGLRTWMTQLAKNRETIGASLDNVSALLMSVAGLVKEARGPFAADLRELHRLAGGLNKPENKAQIIDMLDKLPGMMQRMTRTGTYGSWYNYYICGFILKIQLPPEIAQLPVVGDLADQLTALKVRSTAPRCQ